MTKTAEKVPQKPSLKAVWRAVASSTAVETGQDVKQLEQKLQLPNQKFRHITLAS